MEPAEKLFHEIAAALPDAKEGKMFGAMCIKAPNGKAAAMYYHGDMIFKLTGNDQQEAMALDGSHVFTPMEGRPMGGWIVIPYNHHKKWAGFATTSLDYAKTLR